MDERDWLTERFEEHRTHLRAVAYRVLGSASEAEDAVQEAWLRLASSDASGVRNLSGWLTTVVARVCLDILRARSARREEPLEAELAVLAPDGAANPEHEAVLADSVGLALLVVLDTLTPAERLAFVLHDMFAVPFEEIAPIIDRSPGAAKMLASRARRRVRAAPVPDADLARQRAVVAAFLAAARSGDLDALLTILAPDVVVRADARAVPAGAPRLVRGAHSVAQQALTYSGRARSALPALVDGRPGILLGPLDRLSIALIFTVSGGAIAEIDVVADPARLRTLHCIT